MKYVKTRNDTAYIVGDHYLIPNRFAVSQKYEDDVWNTITQNYVIKDAIAHDLIQINTYPDMRDPTDHAYLPESEAVDFLRMEVASLKGQKAALNAEVADLTQRLNQAEAGESELGRQVEELTEQVRVLTRERNQLAEDNETLTEQLRVANQNVSTLTETVETQAGIIASNNTTIQGLITQVGDLSEALAQANATIEQLQSQIGSETGELTKYQQAYNNWMTYGNQMDTLWSPYREKITAFKALTDVVYASSLSTNVASSAFGFSALDQGVYMMWRGVYGALGYSATGQATIRQTITSNTTVLAYAWSWGVSSRSWTDFQSFCSAVKTSITAVGTSQGSTSAQITSATTFLTTLINASSVTAMLSALSTTWDWVSKKTTIQIPIPASNPTKPAVVT